MQILLRDDKFWVGFAGDRDRKQDAQRWCWENWGPEWGEIKEFSPLAHRTTNEIQFNCYFSFHQLAHANWFALKWG